MGRRLPPRALSGWTTMLSMQRRFLGLQFLQAADERQGPFILAFEPAHEVGDTSADVAQCLVALVARGARVAPQLIEFALQSAREARYKTRGQQLVAQPWRRRVWRCAHGVGGDAGEVGAVEDRALERAGLDKGFFGHFPRGVVGADQQIADDGVQGVAQRGDRDDCRKPGPVLADIRSVRRCLRCRATP
jgi:hypothetical protein